MSPRDNLMPSVYIYIYIYIYISDWIYKKIPPNAGTIIYNLAHSNAQQRALEFINCKEEHSIQCLLLNVSTQQKVVRE